MGKANIVRSLPHGSVDRNLTHQAFGPPRQMSLPHGSVDRNICSSSWMLVLSSSLPHGSVDRNRLGGIRRAAGSCRSLTGAWIETARLSPIRTRSHGRSLTGAWIETRQYCSNYLCNPSLPHGSVDRNRCRRRASVKRRVAPSRERGSKHQSADDHLRILGRSLTGAWIETRSICVRKAPIPSLPHGSVDRNDIHRIDITTVDGRSLTGAWIETRAALASSPNFTSRSLTGAWIETAQPRQNHRLALSLPHGSVDRNVLSDATVDRYGGRSLTGAWIETNDITQPNSTAYVAPSRERGSKPAPRQPVDPALPSLPHGSVDRNKMNMSRRVVRSGSLPHGSVDRNTPPAVVT